MGCLFRGERRGADAATSARIAESYVVRNEQRLFFHGRKLDWRLRRARSSSCCRAQDLSLANLRVRVDRGPLRPARGPGVAAGRALTQTRSSIKAELPQALVLARQGDSQHGAPVLRVVPRPIRRRNNTEGAAAVNYYTEHAKSGPCGAGLRERAGARRGMLPPSTAPSPTATC
jgi:hypothetical protein